MSDKQLQQEKQENIMGTLPVNRLLFTMAWPMVLAMVIQGCYNIVDSMFVSYIAPDAFVALSLVYPVQTMMVAVNVGIGVGINTLLSRRLGQRRYDEANDVAAHGYALYFLVGLLFAAVGLLGAHPFMTLFSDNPAVIGYGTTYLQIVTGLSMGVCLQFAGERMMQATGNPIWNMYIQASGAVINLILDPIFIFGLFGFPELGITGAALATVTGQWIGALIGIDLVRRRVRQIHVSFRHFRPKLSIIKPILRVGLPAIAVQSMSTFMTLGLNKIFASYSETYVAVVGAYFRIQYFVYTVVFGLSNAVVPIISFNYGACSKARVEGTVRAAMATALVSMSAGMVLLLLIPEGLLALFHMTPEAVAIGVPALRMVSVSFAAAGISLVCSYTFQAIGSNSFSLLLALLRQIVLLLPLAAVLAQIDLTLTWWAFPVTEWVCCILAVVLFRHAHQRRIAPLEG